MVHTADVQDRDGSKMLAELRHRSLGRLQILFADGGYSGAKMINWFARWIGWQLQIIKRSDGVKGYEKLPTRWIVERTFGWITLHRRHARDYEELERNSESMIYITMIRLMSRQLATLQTIE